MSFKTAHLEKNKPALVNSCSLQKKEIYERVRNQKTGFIFSYIQGNTLYFAGLNIGAFYLKSNTLFICLALFVLF